MAALAKTRQNCVRVGGSTVAAGLVVNEQWRGRRSTVVHKKPLRDDERYKKKKSPMMMMFTQQQQQQQQQDYILCMMHASMRNEATEPKRHEIKYRNANAKISSSRKKKVKVWSLV
eukprot:scaffold36481_cov160-Amphora_coffeaeformis.AAC.3